IADAALFPFVRQFHFCDVKRLEHWKMAHLRTWLESFLTSARFERVMAKRPVWQSASVNAN
ncbi:MAG: glutathione S-transferase, partial [Myxococcota bacterium]